MLIFYVLLHLVFVWVISSMKILTNDSNDHYSILFYWNKNFFTRTTLNKIKLIFILFKDAPNNFTKQLLCSVHYYPTYQNYQLPLTERAAIVAKGQCPRSTVPARGVDGRIC
jgi:hypothetical protein